jgi:hypothetical protein
MTQWRRPLIVMPLLLGMLLVAVEVIAERGRPLLAGRFTVAASAQAVPARVVESDFRTRLAQAGAVPDLLPASVI